MRRLASLDKQDYNILDEHLYEIAHRLLQVHHNVYREIEKLPARFATREEIYRRLHLVRDYVDASFNTPVTLVDMARIAGFSPNHLLRSFKQLFLQTPHQYIISKRLEVAERLQIMSDTPVTDICLQVGFESPTTFSTTFHRRYGLSPRQYRVLKR